MLTVFKDLFMPTWEEFEEIKEKATERLSKDIYVLAGASVVKVRLEAKKREDFFESYECAGLKCTVLEVDGITIPADQGLELAEEINVEGSSAISQEEGVGVLEDTLKNFGLNGQIKPISEEFAYGQIKLNSLRKRIYQNKQRREK